MSDLLEGKKRQGALLLVGVFAVAYTLNYWFVQMGYSPFLYCWFRPIGAIFEGWLQLGGVLSLVGFCIVLWQQKLRNTIAAFCLVILIYGLPQFLDTIFRLGGTCG